VFVMGARKPVQQQTGGVVQGCMYGHACNLVAVCLPAATCCCCLLLLLLLVVATTTHLCFR
jgi:hypothetical protein